MRHAALLRPMMADVSRELNDAHRAGANLLFEGAQGTLLDVDHGTYPLSPRATAWPATRPPGPASGRACCTTCSASPRPTARASAAARSRPNSTGRRRAPGHHMSTVGAEFGVTTGRSAAAAGSTLRCSSARPRSTALTGLCITKLDVLDGIARTEAVHGLRIRRRIHRHPPARRRRDRTLHAGLRRHAKAGTKAPSASPSTTSLPINARALSSAHRAGHRRADPHGVDQPGPRSHDHDAPSVPGRLGLRTSSKQTPGLKDLSMLTEDGKHLYVSYDEYHNLIEKLAIKVHQSGWEFDTILCLARGGMRPGDMLSRIFDKPLAIMSTSSYRAEAGTTAGPSRHRPLHHHAQGRDRGQGPAGRRPGRFRPHAACGRWRCFAAITRRSPNAQRRHLDQGALDLHARLFGRVSSDEPVDPPALRRL